VLPKIRHAVFWPTLIALLLSLALSLYDESYFLSITSEVNGFILEYFSFLFSSGTILLLIAAVLLMLSPVGRVRIGGKSAVPILSRWRWFSIILCTTVATGILFWGMAEPM
jgi:choline-glycine betaine transporter